MKIISLLLVLIIHSSLLGQDYEFYNQRLSDEQKKMAIHLEKSIMAPCCFGGPIYMHGKNSMTEAAKIDIRRLIIEGKTEDEILDFFRNSIDPRTGKPYGNRILAAPKSDETIGKVSYWTVVIFSFIGLIILALVLRRFLTKTDISKDSDSVSSDTIDAVESELANRDSVS